MAPRRLPRHGPSRPVQQRTYYVLIACVMEHAADAARSECLHQDSNNYRAVEAKANRFLRDMEKSGLSAGVVMAQYRQVGPRHTLERKLILTNERGTGDRLLARELRQQSKELVHFVEPGEPPPTPPVQRLAKQAIKKARQLLGGPRFELFAVQVTPDAQSNILQKEIDSAFQRFLKGDWGLVTKDVKEKNDRAVRLGKGTLRAHYHGARGSFVIVAKIGGLATLMLAEELGKKGKKRR